MKDGLIEQSTGFVYWLFRRFRAAVYVREDWADDILSSGFVGLTMAARRYTPGRGSFLAYARKYIWGQMLSGLSRWNEIPPDVLRRYLRIKRHRERLRRSRASEPSPAELARAAGCRVSTVKHTLRWVEGRCYLSPDAPARARGRPAAADCGCARIADVLPDGRDMESRLERSDQVARVLAACSPEQRRLLEAHFLEGRPLAELAERNGDSVADLERALDATLADLRRRFGVEDPAPPALPRSFPLDRFWSNVDRSGECWIWTGTRTRQGYGQFSEKRGSRWVHHLAHRVSWMLGRGAIPRGHSVVNACGDPRCVRPEHLQATARRRCRATAGV